MTTVISRGIIQNYILPGGAKIAGGDYFNTRWKVCKWYENFSLYNDDNFYYDENSKKFSYDHFSLFMSSKKWQMKTEEENHDENILLW